MPHFEVNFSASPLAAVDYQLDHLKSFGRFCETTYPPPFGWLGDR
jgi:hypothetical protein